MISKKKVFIILGIAFILLMIFFAYDISSKTSAPWEKKKELIKKYKAD
jgi:preprotein translocase subunit SecG